MSASDYTVKIVSTVAELQAACDVRMKVFTDEQGFDANLEIDEHDSESIHFILFLTSNPQKVVGTVRYCPYPYLESTETTKSTSIKNFPTNGVKSKNEVIEALRLSAIRNKSSSSGTGTAGAKLGRLALLKETRGKKLGDKTVKDAEEWIEEALKKESEVERIQYLASAQMYAVGFYEKLGYKPEGEPYDDDGQPHKMCRKIVNLS